MLFLVVAKVTALYFAFLSTTFHPLPFVFSPVPPILFSVVSNLQVLIVLPESFVGALFLFERETFQSSHSSVCVFPTFLSSLHPVPSAIFGNLSTSHYPLDL